MTEAETLEAILSEARRQTDLLVVIALRDAREAAAALLTTQKHRTVYGLSDGSRSSRQIETSSGVPKSTVIAWWKEWRRAGLAVEEGGSVRSLFSIDQLDLPSLVRAKGRA
jgi:hypothetical protein